MGHGPWGRRVRHSRSDLACTHAHVKIDLHTKTMDYGLRKLLG